MTRSSPTRPTSSGAYMSFAQLVALVESRHLFFANVAQLDKDDKWEGMVPRLQMQYLAELDTKEGRSHDYPRLIDSLKRHASNVGVNCWHINAHESAAMWKLYGESSGSVAIQSTVDALQASLEPQDVTIGRIQYLDFDKDELPNFLLAQEPCFLKRKSFAHENELRAMTIIVDVSLAQLVNDPPLNTSSGKALRCRLRTLIKKVYVSPTAPKWFTDTVKGVLKRYKLTEIDVVQSDLDRDPVY